MTDDPIAVETVSWDIRIRSSRGEDLELVRKVRRVPKEKRRDVPSHAELKRQQRGVWKLVSFGMIGLLCAGIVAVMAAVADSPGPILIGGIVMVIVLLEDRRRTTRKKEAEGVEEASTPAQKPDSDTEVSEVLIDGGRLGIAGRFDDAVALEIESATKSEDKTSEGEHRDFLDKSFFVFEYSAKFSGDELSVHDREPRSDHERLLSRIGRNLSVSNNVAEKILFRVREGDEVMIDLLSALGALTRMYGSVPTDDLRGQAEEVRLSILDHLSSTPSVSSTQPESGLRAGDVVAGLHQRHPELGLRAQQRSIEEDYRRKIEGFCD